MKIAIDHQIFTGQKYGGISKYHICLAKASNKIGNEVLVFAPFHNNAYLKKNQEIEYHTYLRNIPAKTRAFFNLVNRKIAKKNVRNWNPDLIHETYYSSKTIGDKETPIVITVHDMIHELYPNFFSNSEKISEKKLRAVNRADQIICVSNNTKSDLLYFFDIPEQKVSVIHHGFDNYNFNKTGSNTHIYKHPKPFLLYVGRRKGYKNFKKLIKAFSISNRLKYDFDIIAFGGGKLTFSEINLIDDYKIKNSIKQIGGNDEILTSLYKQASALIFPSLYEGFGMPLIEAMANGCPVIASNCGSIPEIVGNAAELFDPQNVDSILFSIEKVIYSENLKQELIQHGYRRSQNYSWEKCAQQTNKVYRKSIEN